MAYNNYNKDKVGSGVCARGACPRLVKDGMATCDHHQQLARENARRFREKHPKKATYQYWKKWYDKWRVRRRRGKGWPLCQRCEKKHVAKKGGQLCFVCQSVQVFHEKGQRCAPTAAKADHLLDVKKLISIDVMADLRGKTVPAFSVAPEDLTLVFDPKHPLYDERVNLPIDEDMVKNIMVNGVIEAVIVRKNGDLLEVADGRQRVKNAREANKRLRTEGRPPVKVIVIPRSGLDKDIVGVGISANEFRRPDAVLIKAAKAQRMLNFGATWNEVAISFGTTIETVENWVKLLSLHPKIIKAVAEGRVKYTVAMRLVRLPRQKQMKRFRKLVKAGATNANAVRVVVDGQLERVCPPSKQQLRRVADAFVAAKQFLTTDQVSDCYSFVAWVLGRISTDELFDCLTSTSAGNIAEAVKQGMGL